MALSRHAEIEDRRVWAKGEIIFVSGAPVPVILSLLLSTEVAPSLKLVSKKGKIAVSLFFPKITLNSPIQSINAIMRVSFVNL